MTVNQQPVPCDELHYPTGGPFSEEALRALPDEKLARLLGPRQGLTPIQRRRVECEAQRRRNPQHEEILT